MAVVASWLGRPCLAVIALLAGIEPALSADDPRAAYVDVAPARTLTRAEKPVPVRARVVLKTPAVRTSVAPPIQEANGWAQSGVASWYGGIAWQGKLTASGARYDENILTAAHATLPIGTRVRVTLVGSTRSVIVTINDRPGTRTRIIDLSRAAARDLGILSRGLAQVILTRAEV